MKYFKVRSGFGKWLTIAARTAREAAISLVKLLGIKAGKILVKRTHVDSGRVKFEWNRFSLGA